MRRLLADRLVLTTGAIVIAMAGLFAGLRAGYAQPSASGGKVVARADIAPRSGSQATGSATFAGDGKGGLVLHVEMRGLPPGPRAVHIHENGDCSALDAKSAGDHWNPTHLPHGKWGAAGGHHHLGDIGNIAVGADGKGAITLETAKWTAGTGAANDVIGKSIVVHAGVDDFTGQPAGNAGDRIGCGVIEKSDK